MAKTNPIGVRFRQDILEKLKVDHSIEGAQKALIFLEQFYVAHYKLAKDVTESLRNEPPKINTSIRQYPLEDKDVDREIDNSEIEKQIAAVKAAKMPDGMNKRVWEFDQNKRLKILKNQLK